MTRLIARRLTLALVGVAWLTPSAARAISPAAEELFLEGRRLLLEGKTSEACARLRESYAAEASSGTLLNLALCHEKLGKTATAWTEYRSAARLARQQGREDRAVVADQKAIGLEAVLPRLEPVPVKVVPGLVVATEAGTIAEDVFGVAVPIDPGAHTVIATAPGYGAWRATVQLKERELKTLAIPELIPLPPPQTATTKPAITAFVTIETLPLETPTQPQRPAPVNEGRLDMQLAAAGGVLLATGTLAWSVAYARFDAAQEACNLGSGCSAPERASRISTIEKLEAVAIGSWVCGGALLIGSGIHYVLRKQTAPVSVAIDPIHHGVSVGAAF